MPEAQTIVKSTEALTHYPQDLAIYYNYLLLLMLSDSMDG